jgi:acetate kinase
LSACVAVINAGSSSIKFALYKDGADQLATFRGQVERIGTAPRMMVSDVEGRPVANREWPSEGFDHHMAAAAIFDTARELLQGTPVAAVGHRVVHGGINFAAPVRIDEDVMAELQKLCPLAPLHQPHNLAPIAAIAEVAPHIPQVACFDTAFHRNQPELAQLFALPREITDAGVRRYGFHGLSYEYVSGRLYELAPELADARVLIAHLGNGASLCAVRSGRSVATTMGFTAVDGLMMGTRCGNIDPGVLLYLMDERGMDARAIEDLIYRHSGLLGVSGISSDMRTLQTSTDPAAAEAINLFVYRIVREIGSLAAALGGLDAIVFTGGIGERAAKIRSDVAKGCAWLGAELSAERNEGGDGLISADSSKLPVWVMPTDEERMMALHTSRLLELNQANPEPQNPEVVR